MKSLTKVYVSRTGNLWEGRGEVVDHVVASVAVIDHKDSAGAVFETVIEIVVR